MFNSFNELEKHANLPQPAYSTVAAAGSGLSTAALLSPGMNDVTGASGTNGVILPADADVVFVFNDNGSNALLIYPPTSSLSINGGSAGASYSLTADRVAMFYLLPNGNWVGGKLS